MNYKKIVVAGGGVLGSQIAFQTAYCGFQVTVWLRSEESIERAKPKFERLRQIYLDTLEKMKTDKSAYCRGLTDKQDLDGTQIDELKKQVERAYNSITYTTDYDEAERDADLVIEAIAENPQDKINFYKELSKHLPDKAVIVTNSSTMLPSTFAEYTGRPEKYLALHFANQIWKNNTAEIMGQPKTDQKYYDQIVSFAEAIHMVPLRLSKEQPGYILNSLLVPFLDAAQALYANEVADPETIDLTWKLATGAPAGPFRILDVVGLVTAYNIAAMNPDANKPNSTASKILAKLKEKIDAGKTGVNAGEGFYKY